MLRERLENMGPFAFERLICDLLSEMGYEDVEVTQPSNDKGVDVKAVAQLGITTINEVIQVKRHRANIQRPVLDMLRGSLHRFKAQKGNPGKEIRCQLRKEIRCQLRKSGVSSSFLPEKRNRHRITRLPEKRNRHRITRKEEPTPDYSDTIEGGYFRVTYRAFGSIPASLLPPGYPREGMRSLVVPQDY
jgi:hypothetical protein